MKYPSIFNDVIGPVMRGPSSSHCAASLRIGRLCRDLMGGTINQATITYDHNGSLATTHDGQGSDMGLLSGFLGWEADDARLPDYKVAIREANIDVVIQIEEIQANHPNTYQIVLRNSTSSHRLTALSLGGGMIEVIELDRATISLAGDYLELIIYTDQADSVKRLLKTKLSYESLNHCIGDQEFLQVQLVEPIGDDLLTQISQISGVESVVQLQPVLPILSRHNMSVPFDSVTGLLEYNQKKNHPLWQLAQIFEAERGAISQEQVWLKMKHIVGIMASAVELGLQGTQYADRILPAQSVNFLEQMQRGNLIAGDTLNQVIASVSAIMEVKSAMGVIVAAPTAGSCGALPGAVLGVARSLGRDEEEIIKALLTAGMIGYFIAHRATFAAEVGGCQAECGSGAGMAAAAITQLAGGTLEQSLVAASLALQNSFGMVCDPIANRVEAPCLGKNVMAATNALACANMALSDYDPLIPLDEVIEAMGKTGASLPHELRCTGLGGLAITPTAKAIEKRLSGSGMLGQSTCGTRYKVC